MVNWALKYLRDTHEHCGEPDESRLPINMLEGECYIPRVRPSAVAVISEDYEFDLIKRRMATMQYSDFDQGLGRLD